MKNIIKIAVFTGIGYAIGKLSENEKVRIYVNDLKQKAMDKMKRNKAIEKPAEE